MDQQTQEKIIAGVIKGLSWARAAESSGVRAEDLLTTVFAVKAGRCPGMRPFLKRLEDAGKVATENSLKHHAKRRNHA